MPTRWISCWIALLFLGRLSVAQVSEYCFGTSCPCGNDDVAAGCGNLGFDGSIATGAQLVAVGSPEAPDLALSGMQGSQFGLIYMGGAALELPFGDGKRCVGAGSVGIHRFPLRTAGAFGDFLELDVVAGSQSFSGGGAISAGNTYYFQAWYRDPGGPCGSQFNLSNGVSVVFPGPPAVAGTQLAGRPLAEYPWFEVTASVREGDPLYVAIDPGLYPFAAGRNADIYVVEAKSPAQWELDPSLDDVRLTGPSAVSISGSSLVADTFLVDAGTLSGTLGTEIGIGYDVVVDLDRNGLYDGQDLLDGASEEAGFYCVRDTAAPGPYTVVESLYSGGTWLGQDLYYPANVASLGELPLLVVSHGNGHNYRWYDHIGFHMASYGYVVMSHTNQTGPGIESASGSTLANTDYLLGNLDTIAGGALEGHVDGNRILWIGHSRGGEGVTRAYDRIYDGVYTPVHYELEDIRLVSSIAPTDYLGIGLSNPHEVDYHLWVGSADADVSGIPGTESRQSYHLLERAEGRRASFSLHGGGHAVFHDGGGSLVASGPCLVQRSSGHPVMVSYLLTLARYFVDDDPAAKDFLWRQYESFRPTGAPVDACVVVQLEFNEEGKLGRFVLDDFESAPSPTLSSSGTAVSYDVVALTEGPLDDGDSSFTDLASDPMNGMTRLRDGETHQSGVVFEWSSPAYYEVEVPADGRDVTGRGFLSFRACQVTRDALTIAALEDLTFSVALRDGQGVSRSIRIGAYGGGLEEPYQRTGAGSGVGWGNEFETIRIRLADFIADGSGLDLSDIVAVRFEFGESGSSPVGRIGLDDLVWTAD